MMKLTNQAKTTLVPRLEVAATLWPRMRGLLGRDRLEKDQGLWILKCRSVHTFFMKFEIDLVFLNRDLVVTKTVTRVKPGRLVWPVWSASSVIELAGGFLNDNPIRVGEKVYVDPALS